MIVLFTSNAGRATHQQLARRGAPPQCRIFEYSTLTSGPHLPLATYLFTDMDRLGVHQLQFAAQFYRALRSHGFRVLNDPARVLNRYGLLRALYRAGLNPFDIHRWEEGVTPRRWPVFLRLDGGHSGAQSDLLHDPAQLAQAVEAALQRGVPSRELLVVEYAAEPLPSGTFVKRSAYRVGEAIVPGLSVHQESWQAKMGVRGLGTAEEYAEERRLIRDNPWRDALMGVFELAHIEYGRIDFGFVGGNMVVYEINTNPLIVPPGDRPHPSPIRQESTEHAWAAYLEAMRRLDTAYTPG